MLRRNITQYRTMFIPNNLAADMILQTVWPIQITEEYSKILISGVWKDIISANIIIGGLWRNVDSIYAIKNNVWISQKL